MDYKGLIESFIDIAKHCNPVFERVHSIISDLRNAYQGISNQIFLKKLEICLFNIANPMTDEERNLYSTEFANCMENKEKVFAFLSFLDSMIEKEMVLYFSNLTRCAIINHMPEETYLTFIHLLRMCSVPSLKFLERCIAGNSILQRNFYITSLCNLSIFEPVDTGKLENEFQITKLGLLMKKYALNYNVVEKFDISSTDNFEPIGITEAITKAEISKMFNQ